MSDNPLSGKVGLDVSDFKGGITEMNSSIRVIESGFKATAASLGDWGRSVDGLEARNKALTGQIEIQRVKVKALKDEYNNLSASGKASALALAQQQIKINQATEALNKNEAELRQNKTAMDGLKEPAKAAGREVAELGKKAEQTGGKFNFLKSTMQGIGGVAKFVGGMVAGLATTTVAAGLGIGGMVYKTAQTADALVDLSNKTGISTTRLQELAYVGGQVGTDVDTVAGSLAKLTRNMGTVANNPKGDAAQAFKTLGVAVTDTNGKLLDSESVFYSTIDALGKIENETERDVLAMAVFGKSAMELNPLIKATSEEVARLSRESHEMGAVMSDENVQAAAELADQMDGLKNSAKGIGMTLASAFLPLTGGVLDVVSGYVGRFAGIVKGADGDIGKMSAGISSMVMDIVRIAASQGPKMLEAGLTIVQGLITAIIGALPQLLPAAISMITALISFLGQNLPLLMQAGMLILVTLINGILPLLPMLIETGLQVLIALIQGISAAIPTLIPTIVQVMLTIVQTLIENLPLLIGAAIQLIMALVTGLIAALPILIEQAPAIIGALVSGLITAIPMLLTAAVQIPGQLVAGIIQALPQLWQAGKGMINEVIKAASGGNEDLESIGNEIVNGVWAGIQAGAATFYENVMNFFKGLIDAVKKFLGIASPSKEFAWLGEMSAAGYGNALTKGMKRVARHIGQQMGGLTMELAPAAAGIGTQINDQSSAYYAPVYHIYGAIGQDSSQKARRW